MHFVLGTIAKEDPGPDLTIDCLWCGKEGLSALLAGRGCPSRSTSEIQTASVFLPASFLQIVSAASGIGALRYSCNTLF